MKKPKTSMIKMFIIQSDFTKTEKQVNEFAFDNELIIKDIKAVNETTIIVIFED